MSADVCPWCAGGSRNSDWGPYCSGGCEYSAALAQARAEGEAAGAARERAAVVAWLRETVWAADEADYIERGKHVGAAGGAA